MPYNLPTDNKIDVKHINLRLKEYVEERIRIKDESAKKLSKVFDVVSHDLVNLQNQSNTQAAAINNLSTSGGGGGSTGTAGTSGVSSFSNVVHQSFSCASPSTSWTFVHNLDTQFVIVQVYDENYNQIIPQNI